MTECAHKGIPDFFLVFFLCGECVYEYRTNLFPALWQEFGFHPSGTHMSGECHTPGQNHLPGEEDYSRVLSNSLQNRFFWSVYTCADAQVRTHLCSSSGLLIRLKRMCSSWSLSLGSGCRQAVHRIRGINSCGHTQERRSNNMQCTGK